MKIHGFPKQERIVSLKLIDELFNSGQSHSLTAFPLRAVYLVRNSPCESVAKEESMAEKDSPCESVASKNSPCESVAKTQLLLSVPKRRFKHAVDRNHVKRPTREAYRTQKLPLHAALEKTGQTIEVAFLYVDNKFITFEQTYKLMGKAIGKLQRAIHEAAKKQPS